MSKSEPTDPQLPEGTIALDILAKDLLPGDRPFDTWHKKPGSSVVQKVMVGRKAVTVVFSGSAVVESFNPNMKFTVCRQKPPEPEPKSKKRTRKKKTDEANSG